MVKSVTILGAQGMVGRQLSKKLVEQGITPWCPSRTDEFELFNRPLGDVYYCAGLTADYYKRPFDTVNAHVCLLAQLLKGANFKRLVYLSSTRLYDSLGDIKTDEDAVLRISPSDPRHLYDLTKALGENLCLTTSDGRAKVVRLACVVGTNLDDDGFIPSLLKQAQGRNSIYPDTSPYFSRDYIGLDDVVNMVIRILNEGKLPIYNLASGMNVSNKQLFTLIEKLTKCVVKGNSHARSVVPLIDVRNISQEFGFVPTPLEELLVKLLSVSRQV